MKLLIIFLLIACPPFFIAKAENVTTTIPTPVAFGIDLFSIHSAAGYNDINPGIYFEFKNGVTVGTYYNSNYKESTYLALTQEIYRDIDITLGFTTGYQLYKYTPLIVPSYKLHPFAKDDFFRIIFIPKFAGDVGANVVHFTYEHILSE